jgi:hypothetical protein
MTTVAAQMITNNAIQMAAHNALVDGMLQTLSLRFQGGNKVSSELDESIQSEIDIFQFLEMQLQLSGAISARTPLVTYWRPLITQRLNKLKMAETGIVISNIAYNGSDPTELEELVELITGVKDKVTIAVLKHFLWQVKRKLIDKEVSWHMMPILWGKTGSGKSVLLNKLFAPLRGYVHTGLALDKLGDDRYYRQFSEHFIIFLDEMPKIEKASIEAVKQIITASELTGRILYSNSSKMYKQNCTFIGTSNEAPSQLIKDYTSMRRFHYIKTVDKMDYEKVNTINMLNVWRSVDERLDKPYILDVFSELEASQEEVRQKDALELFISEAGLIKDESYMTKSQDIYDEYIDYCDKNGYKMPLAKQGFNRQLIERFEFKKVDYLTGAAARYPHFHIKMEEGKKSKVIDRKGLK